MSLQYNDITNKKGIIQQIEKELGLSTGASAIAGDIAGNTGLLADFTAEVNITLDDYFSLALSASGKWQLDDSNQIDYPIITSNLVSGQRDYPFTTDGSGNLILDIYAVYVLTATSNGIYQQIYPVDIQSDGYETASFTDGKNVSGISYRYDKTANAIFLDPIPNYNATAGLKIYINREASYFLSSDTTKKPGVPGLHHEYFAIKPALKYAARKGLAVYKDLYNRVQKYEEPDGMIETYFGGRAKDQRDIISGTPILFR